MISHSWWPSPCSSILIAFLDFLSPRLCPVTCAPLFSLSLKRNSPPTLESTGASCTLPTRAPPTPPQQDCLPHVCTHQVLLHFPFLSWVYSRVTPLLHGRPLMSIAFCAQAVFWVPLPGNWLGLFLGLRFHLSEHVRLHIPERCIFPILWHGCEDNIEHWEREVRTTTVLISNTLAPRYAAPRSILCSGKDEAARTYVRTLEWRFTFSALAQRESFLDNQRPQ